MNSIKLNVSGLADIDIINYRLLNGLYWRIPRPRFPLGVKGFFALEFTNG